MNSKTDGFSSSDSAPPPPPPPPLPDRTGAAQIGESSFDLDLDFDLDLFHPNAKDCMFIIDVRSPIKRLYGLSGSVHSADGYCNAIDFESPFLEPALTINQRGRCAEIESCDHTGFGIESTNRFPGTDEKN